MPLCGGAAIANSGHTTLENSSVIEARGTFGGAIYNRGTLEIFNSLIADNRVGGLIGDAGGIVNDGGSLLLENSTVARNFGTSQGGISSFGGNVVIRNSSIVFNFTSCCTVGGGIGIHEGSAEITNTTIAQNRASGGGGVSNRGVMTITNSTIRENLIFLVSSTLLAAESLTLAPEPCAYKTRSLQEIHSNVLASVRTASVILRVLETTS